MLPVDLANVELHSHRDDDDDDNNGDQRNYSFVIVCKMINVTSKKYPTRLKMQCREIILCAEYQDENVLQLFN